MFVYTKLKVEIEVRGYRFLKKNDNLENALALDIYWYPTLTLDVSVAMWMNANSPVLIVNY